MRGIRITLAATGLALLALGPATAQATVSASIDPQGRILVVGDEGPNNITISDQSDPACPAGPPCYEIKSASTAAVATPPCVATTPPAGAPATALCPRAGVSWIIGIGREGDDSLLLSDFVFGLGVPATLEGGTGDDHLEGSFGADVLRGGVDDDEIRGGDGNDRMDGNAGSDRMYGAKGRDYVYGGPGGDDLFGGLGNDLMFGASGKDLLDGLQGKDRCNGGGSKDAGRRCEKSVSIP